MHINFTWRFAVAFMAFVFVFGQLHEMAHLITVYLISGQPGHQTDFNLWTISPSVSGHPYVYLASAAGPLFSYAMMWMGYYFMKRRRSEYQLPGIVLVLGNLPFARLFTAGMGGGDETTVLRHLLAAEWPVLGIKLLGFAIVFLLAFPPFLAACKLLIMQRWLIAGLAIGPLIIMMGYEFKLLGLVANSGFLGTSHLLGVSDFIYLHTALMVLIVVLLRKSLFLNEQTLGLKLKPAF